MKSRTPSPTKFSSTQWQKQRIPARLPRTARGSPLDFCVAKVLHSALSRTHVSASEAMRVNLAPQLHPPPHPRAGEVLPTPPRKAVFLSGVRGRFLLLASKESAPGRAAGGLTPCRRPPSAPRPCRCAPRPRPGPRVPCARRRRAPCTGAFSAPGRGLSRSGAGQRPC